MNPQKSLLNVENHLKIHFKWRNEIPNEDMLEVWIHECVSYRRQKKEMNSLMDLWTVSGESALICVWSPSEERLWEMKQALSDIIYTVNRQIMYRAASAGRRRRVSGGLQPLRPPSSVRVPNLQEDGFWG